MMLQVKRWIVVATVIALWSSLAIFTLETNAQGIATQFGDTVYQSPPKVVPKDDFKDIFRSVLPLGNDSQNIRNAKPGGVLIFPGHDPTKQDSICKDVCVRDDTGKIFCFRTCTNKDLMKQ